MYKQYEELEMRILYADMDRSHLPTETKQVKCKVGE